MDAQGARVRGSEQTNLMRGVTDHCPIRPTEGPEREL